MAEPVLKKGSNDPAVRDLQEALKILGFDPGLVDGARLVEVGTAGVEVADGEGVPAGLAQGGDQRFPVRDFARRFGM